jgi:hypothetical protein
VNALPAVLALAALTLAAPGRADAQTADPPGRVRLWLHGGFVPGASDFTGTQTFTEFAEQGRIDAQYHQDAGPVFEIGLGLRLRRRLGLTAAGSFGRRDGTGSFTATLPHPLYFGAFRPASGAIRGTSQREKALHLDLALLGGSSRLQWSAFAGPSLIAVRAELVQRIEYTQAYPFDTVTVTIMRSGSTWAPASTGRPRGTWPSERSCGFRTPPSPSSPPRRTASRSTPAASSSRPASAWISSGS